jgi:HSP20 family protein
MLKRVFDYLAYKKGENKMEIITTTNTTSPLTVGHYGSTNRVLTDFFPSLFSDKWLDSLVSDKLDKFWDIPNSHYPYDVKAFKDKDGNILDYVISVALAGIGKDNIKVKVKDNHLMIDVHKKDESANNSVSYRKGISQRKSELNFYLSDKIDKKKISSKYEDGLLTVNIPIKKSELIDIDIKVS